MVALTGLIACIYKPSSAWAWVRSKAVLLTPRSFPRPRLFPLHLLAYPLEHDERARTIGDMFRRLEEESGKLTYL